MRLDLTPIFKHAPNRAATIRAWLVDVADEDLELVAYKVGRESIVYGFAVDLPNPFRRDRPEHDAWAAALERGQKDIAAELLSRNDFKRRAAAGEFGQRRQIATIPPARSDIRAAAAGRDRAYPPPIRDRDRGRRRAEPKGASAHPSERG